MTNNEMIQLKQTYKPNQEYTKSLKQSIRLNRDTIFELLKNGFDPNDFGSYYEFPYFLQSEDTETFELLKEFGANTDLSSLNASRINDAQMIHFQFYPIYETFILSLRPSAFASVTELEKLKWLKSKGFNFNIPPFLKLQTYSLKTLWAPFLSLATHPLPEVTSFLVNETNLDFNLELNLDDSKIKGKFLNWHYYVFNILVNEYKPVGERKRDFEAFIKLLEGRIQINAQTSEGRNIFFVLPFIRTAQAKEAAKMLIELGVNPFMKDQAEQSFPMLYKDDKNMKSVVQWIEANKGETETKSSDSTPTKVAASSDLDSKQDPSSTSQHSLETRSNHLIESETSSPEFKTQTLSTSLQMKKLESFIATLDFFHKSNTERVGAVDFLTVAKTYDLNEEEINQILDLINQGIHRFSTLNVPVFLRLAEHYLATLDSNDDYQEILLEKSVDEIECVLPIELLPVILNKKDKNIDHRISLRDLFMFSRDLIDDMIVETSKHGEIDDFVNKMHVSNEIGILYYDHTFIVWRGQTKKQIHNVKTLMNIDYFVTNDGLLYRYDGYKFGNTHEYLVVPEIDNIDEVWHENYFYGDQLKLVYRHKTTKELILYGYPQDDFYTSTRYPVRVGFYSNLSFVHYADGTLKYRDNNNKEVIESGVFDARYENRNYIICKSNGEINISGKKYHHNHTVRITDTELWILIDSVTNKILNFDGRPIPHDETLSRTKSYGDRKMMVQFTDGRTFLYDRDQIIYDSGQDFGLATDIVIQKSGIFAFTARNNLLSIGGSHYFRELRMKRASDPNQDALSNIICINDVSEYKGLGAYLAYLTEDGKFYLQADREDWKSFSKAYDKSLVENVRSYIATNYHLVLLKNDGKLETFTRIPKYNGITKTSKFINVIQIASINDEVYLLTADGVCWKFSESSNVWLVVQTGTTRSIFKKPEGLYASSKLAVVKEIESEKPGETSSNLEKIIVRSIEVTGYKQTYFRVENEALNQTKWIHKGYNHLIRIDQFGNILGIGDNNYGSCNIDKWTNVRKAYAIKNASIGLTHDNKLLIACTNKKAAPWIDVPSKDNVKDLAAVEDTVIVIYQNGATLTYSNQLAKWETISNSGQRLDVHAGKIYLVEAVDAAFAVPVNQQVQKKPDSKEEKKSAALKAQEMNRQKKKDYLDNPNRHRISVAKQHMAMVMGNGRVVAYGDNTYGQCEVDTWTDIVTVAAGNKFTIGLKKGGDAIISGISYRYSQKGNYLGFERYRNHLIGSQYGDIGAVDDSYSVVGLTTRTINSKGYIFYADLEENSSRSSKYKDVVGTIYHHKLGMGCYLDIGGRLLDQNFSVIDQGIISVAKEKYLVRDNGLQSIDGEIIHPEVPMAYDYDEFGLFYLDKEGVLNYYLPDKNEKVKSQWQVNDQQLYGNLSRVYAHEYQPFISYANETIQNNSRAAFPWQLSHQLANFKDSYVGIDQNDKLVCSDKDLDSFVHRLDKPIRAVFSSTKQITVLFQDGTTATSGKEDLSDLKNITRMSVSDTNMIFLDKYGQVFVYGNNDYAQKSATEWTGVVDVAAGTNYVLGLTDQGKVLCAGVEIDDGHETSYYYSNQKDYIAIAAFKKTYLSHTKNGYIAISGTILKAEDRLNLEISANIISLIAYEDTIVLVNSEGAIVSNKLKSYRPHRLPDRVVSVVLLKDKIVAKLTDGTIKVYEYEELT